MTDSGRFVVFVTGNESRGDDAAGPLLLQRLEGELPAGARVVCEFQLQVEHALELRGADLVLFIDAACGLDVPFEFAEAVGKGPVSSFSHALSPGAVLDVFRRIEGAEPPPAFVLGLRATRFELGEGLSELAADAVEAALPFTLALLEALHPDSWRKLAQAREFSSPRVGKKSAV
ncbi:hydrogenase maturation protease [Aromatoleum toluclasticum]|uniref:hydrogenase maturation protease n=1 Tax=Aromatoleum toluclasticum TaxID=92003 RepID=UPI001D196661|nr:hydrogenase maturation protease [Aromatoleum toluclasticum]MCC4117117.1 hydrogenase maturation protease [Aromatoleum toluclasticum]